GQRCRALRAGHGNSLEPAVLDVRQRGRDWRIAKVDAAGDDLWLEAAAAKRYMHHRKSCAQSESLGSQVRGRADPGRRIGEAAGRSLGFVDEVLQILDALR